MSDLKSVAIVDEVPGRLAVLAQSMDHAGFIAIPILGGRTAMRLFALFRPDVVVIDADLTTGITATELCVLLNGSYKGDSSPVSTIVIAREELPWFSSNDSKLVSDYLILPFTAHHLIQAIQRLLDLHDDSQADRTPPAHLIS